MKTSSAKAKGRRCSQEVKELILRFFGTEMREDDITVTPSGVTGPDLMFSPLAKGLLGLAIECKNVESLNVWKSLEQAENEGRHGTPTLFFRRNRSKLYVALEAEEFLNILAKANIK